ncbi:MAG: LLM class flavin-dependent oxidoreductase [Anaerolineae bacterium]|nr:LLM class flavin-dependent oxidoreductase [Anaerolineae bacterium]MDW8099492.1 LLM class flavin-dependent oxidoreductase [Anaerolineae bacterium]
MRFSIRLNNDLSISTYIRLAQVAEATGFDQIWVSNDLFLRSAPVIVSAIASATRRIEIGTGVLNPYTIHPAEIAMLAATMDELTGCRFNLGLAAGAADFLDWVGIEQARPLAMMWETIEAIRRLLAGERVAMQGKMLRWGPEAYLRFRAPRVTPIYLGAMSPRMLELAGELADGALPLLLPPEHYFAAREIIERGLQRRRPGLPTLDLAACIWASLDEDRHAARQALAEKIAYYGHALSPLILGRLGLSREDFAPIERAIMAENNLEKACQLVDERMLQVGVVGDAEEVAARLKPLVEAGVTHLSFGPPLGPDPITAVQLLGEKVIPQLL